MRPTGALRDTELVAVIPPEPIASFLADGGYLPRGVPLMKLVGGADDPRPTLVLANRSDIDLARQVTAPGATWLDHRLVERQPMPLSMGGFGGEVREAMTSRRWTHTISVIDPITGKRENIQVGKSPHGIWLNTGL